MIVKTVYILDTSAFIELNKRWPSDIFEKLWDKLEELGRNGLIISPMEVKKELDHKDDKLKKWATENHWIFKDLDAPQLRKVVEIVTNYPGLVDVDKETPDADPFVIALASMEDPQQTLIPTQKMRVVVSEERLKGHKTKIPYVCQQCKIECMTVLELFKKEGWKF
jgi:hypothetical protein